MRHIGFIMDGNRTWAKNNGLESLEWHSAGYDNIQTIIDCCQEKNIEYVSFWALSDDNIQKRSTMEVKWLFDLLTQKMPTVIKNANTQNLRLEFIWNPELIRKDCLGTMEIARKSTKNNTGMTVIFAIGYGWQDEIVRAVKALSKSGFNFENLKKDDILSAMDTGKFPAIDLIVRTGGHLRHSGFFLYQSPYAEYFFSEKNWPDFDKNEFEKSIQSFEYRIRKFWK